MDKKASPALPSQVMTATGNQQLVLLLALLLLLFAQVMLATRATSITLDEPLHITSGYACLLTGDYRLVEEHPPLLKMLQAAPLLLAKPPLPDPRTVPGWDEANLIEAAQHVVVPYRPIEPLVFAARVPTMLIAILLAALVFRWTADVFGKRAALLALFLLAFDPNILAHAGVAATDLGATCAIFATTYTFWRWLRQPDGPSRSRAILAGVVLGLALGVKSTTLMLGPIFVSLLLLGRPPEKPLWPYIKQAAGIATLAFLTLWASYRFEIGPLPGIDFSIPLASHLKPLLKLQTHMREGHSAFLLGQNYHHGDWRYFPIALLLKTPLLTLGLLAGAALHGIITGLHPTREENQKWILSSTFLRLTLYTLRSPLLLFPLFYFGVSLSSGINIGYRHLLPMLPFLYVTAAGYGQQLITRFAHPLAQFALCTLLAGYALVTLNLFPWHLAYFNALAGGPDGGYRYLVDSNLDWGQTWKALGQYIDAHDITEFNLSQYTINDPHAYGLDYTPLPPWPAAPPVLPQRFAPAPGIYAISANQLQGLTIALPEMFDYFHHLEPERRIGHAMFVYHLAPRPPAEWVAQCALPVASLSPADLAEGLGSQEYRLLTFDCEQSWLIPPGNGWYVLPHAYDGWGKRQAEQGRLAYEQPQSGYAPAFALYEWFDVQPELPDTTTVYAAPSAWPVSQVLAAGTPLSIPVDIGDALTFLGYTTITPPTPGTPWSMTTYWQVRARPTAPLSLMAHLLEENGIPLAVGDGLGVPFDQWQPGSLILQRHHFAIPENTSAARTWLQVGAYTLEDLERAPIQHAGQIVGDRLLVAEIEVTAP